MHSIEYFIILTLYGLIFTVIAKKYSRRDAERYTNALDFFVLLLLLIEMSYLGIADLSMAFVWMFTGRAVERTLCLSVIRREALRSW